MKWLYLFIENSNCTRPKIGQKRVSVFEIDGKHSRYSQYTTNKIMNCWDTKEY